MRYLFNNVPENHPIKVEIYTEMGKVKEKTLYLLRKIVSNIDNSVKLVFDDHTYDIRVPQGEFSTYFTQSRHLYRKYVIIQNEK